MTPNADPANCDSDSSAEAADLRRRLAALQAVVEEQERNIESLRAGKDQFRVLLDESSDPIFSFYANGQYAYVNRAFADGVGKRQDEIIGRTIWDVFSKDEADKRFAAVKWVFEHAERKVLEVRVPRPDGDRYYITTVKPIVDSAGRVSSVICISKEITERKRMEERLAHMAEYDALTDLPNRALFAERLLQGIAMAKRDKTRLALMWLDLDNFKSVNDTFGHHVGDLLLRAAAKRMKEALRESDTVGRIGGDEFVVLLPIIKGDNDAVVVAETIRASLARAFELPECPGVEISSSIGIAIYPDHGKDDVQLMKNADQALYGAKEAGRNRTRIFTAA
jgi:diguanylate cyclase (GGDEF)-like protein/PAS domain S-box-containing protein